MIYMSDVDAQEIHLLSRVEYKMCEYGWFITDVTRESCLKFEKYFGIQFESSIFLVSLRAWSSQIYFFNELGTYYIPVIQSDSRKNSQNTHSIYNQVGD